MTGTQANGALTAEFWRDRGGAVWAELQDLMDALNKPIGEAVQELADPTPGERVLDVGCGGGATTLDVAQRLGPDGLCVGIDIARSLLDLARSRAAERPETRATFIEGDAESYAFEASEFDLVTSRFGVMFFGSPETAFANLRRATKPGGRLAFACWRGPEDNPLSQIPMEAAAPLLPSQPRPEKDAPGRFAFADPDRVLRILGAAGWRDVEITPIDVLTPIHFEDLMRLSLQLGALGPVLREQPEPVRAKVRNAVEAALRPHAKNGVVPMTSACWLVSANN